MWLLKKALPSREEPNTSLSIVKIHVMILYGGVLNTQRHVRGKITSGVAVRCDSCVAGEGRVVGIPKFHS